MHGDLKPENVLLPGGSVEQAKIIDFGIARHWRRGRAGDSRARPASSGSKTTPMTGRPPPEARAPAPGRGPLVVGTPRYMAPEQLAGDVDIDPAADVFALGCVLFECLTGRAPFEADTPAAAAFRRIAAPAPRARDLSPAVPEAVDELLRKLLSADRADRPANGAATAELIARVPSSERGGPRSREGITTAERRLLPAILVVPAKAVAQLSIEGLRITRIAASEDATWDVSTDTVALAERLGPVARRFHARIEILQGGALAVLLESSGLLADRATQAALCGLALRAVAPDVAVAIATGRRGDTDDVIDRAAACLLRARSLAAGPRSARDPGASQPSASTSEGEAPAGIPLDDATFGLLEGRFEIERGASVHLLNGRPRAEDEEGRLLGKPTPCAGREPELGMLDALFRECAHEPAAKAVIVKGPAGSGKSRLRRELLRRLAQRGESMCVWVGRGDVMNAGSPFAILSHAILSMLGLAGGEPDDLRRERLRAKVAERVPADRQERVALFLGEMIGIPFPAAVGPEIDAAREDAILLGDQRRRAFEDFVAAESSEGAVVLVLEDLHLGDLPTVKLVDAALRALADRPFFVLATARPSIDDLFPKLWEERVPQEIRVGPLSPKASEKIVRAVLGPKAAPDLVARIVSRAAGHPLHLEEIVRAVAEGPDRELPDTVLAVVEARLAALDPAARLVLRAASVFGRTFWDGAVAALVSWSAADVRDWLRDLAEKEWLTRAPLSRFPGEPEHVITQDLVQEAAYAMLPEADRARGHRLAGAWLAGAGERDPIVLARHFELGGEPRRAAAWLLRAAEQALEGNDFASAVAHADRAADLDPAPAHHGRACAIAAEAHLHRGELEAARRRGLLAIEQLTPSEAGYFRACAAAVVASGKLGDIAHVADVARALLAVDPAGVAVLPFSTAASHAVVQLVIGGDRPLAEALHARFEAIVRDAPEREPLPIAYLERAAGGLDAFAGDLFGSITHQREAVAAFEAAGDLRTACSMRKTLGWYLGELGALEEAERSLRDAITTAGRMGLTNLSPHAKHDLGTPLLRLGKLDEARRSQEEALVAFAAQGDRRLESSAHALLSGILVAAGHLDDAEREARAAIATASSPPIRFTGLARLAAVHRAAGRHEEAVAAADEALALLEESGTIEECFVLCLLTRAEALAALGRGAEADATLARAWTEIESRASQIRDPDLRASFLSRIPENARVLSLVRALDVGPSRPGGGREVDAGPAGEA